VAIPFFLSEKFTSNPTLVVMGFRRQLVYHLHFWACLAVAPLIVVQWLHQNYLLSALLFLFCANALLVIGFLRFRQHYFLRGWLFPLLAMICAVYSTAINGHTGLYWAYPAITAVFFLMPLRDAAISNFVFLALMAITAFYVFPLSEFWRITTSLGLTCLFALIFAWLVGRLQQEMTELATTDPLTGCRNRATLAESLTHQIKLCERYDRPSSILLLDLDHFKTINDKWGHHTGDTVLTGIARLLSNRLRDNDHIFRIGGEEFIVLLPETSLPEAETLARELVKSVAVEPFQTGIGVTISGGLTQACANETWSAWLKRADQALYKAKSDGRNRVVQLPVSSPPADTGLQDDS
jgi:diguanylate cyclase (GGDEF)-like protein